MIVLRVLSRFIFNNVEMTKPFFFNIILFTLIIDVSNNELFPRNNTKTNLWHVVGVFSLMRSFWVCSFRFECIWYDYTGKCIYITVTKRKFWVSGFIQLKVWVRSSWCSLNKTIILSGWFMLWDDDSGKCLNICICEWECRILINGPFWGIASLR